MTELTIPQILRRAAQAVRDLGFAKGTRHVEHPAELDRNEFWSPGPEARIGSVCALGAIEIAVDKRWHLESDPQAVKAVEVLAKHVPDILYTANHPVTNVVKWNNASERTGIELITLFESAAACEEQKERKES